MSSNITYLNRGTLFDPVLVTDLINKVKGKSSLARLSKQEPIPFNGQKEFTFEMNNEVDIVAESGKKSHGGVKLEPVTIVPVKVEYGARISDEFMYAAEEEKINILKAFNDGFAKKVARGLDLMAFHGVNPRTGQPSTVIGQNHFDALVQQNVVPAGTGLQDPNQAVESAIALVHGSDNDVTGMAMSTIFRSALAAQKDQQGNPMFPELAWGAAPSEINGLAVDVNRTVSDMTTNVRAYVGDFENAFKWGYAKQIPLKIIEYGDPDGSGNDLQNYNQVYLRAEVFLGWGILDPGAFARIVEDTATPTTPTTP